MPTRKVKGLARNTNTALIRINHKILVALRRHNSPPWLNTRSTEAEVEVIHKQQRGV